MLAETGFWPSQVPFEAEDLQTVFAVFEERNKAVKRR